MERKKISYFRPSRDHFSRLLILHNTTRFRKFHFTIIVNQLIDRNNTSGKAKRDKDIG
jgi:hypothetical protein